MSEALCSDSSGCGARTERSMSSILPKPCEMSRHAVVIVFGDDGEDVQVDRRGP